MSRLFRRLLCLCLVLPLLSCALPKARADGTAPPGVRVYVDGLLRLRGYDRAGTLFLSAEDVCTLFAIPFEAERTADGYTLRLRGWELSAPAGKEVFTADGRYLYCPEGFGEWDGRVCFPADLIERLFGLRIRFDGQRADVDTSRFQLLRGGEEYYAVHFHPDDLYWLSHIIYSEADREPLAGMIGVGNVVLNRVANESFPPTVMAVVLDKENRIQFSPVETGGVLADPDETSVIAACLVLEGYNTVGGSLYYVNPDLADDSWFREALVPTVTIGHHHFYTEG